MKAGNLKHPITMQEATVTSDGYGGGEKEWIPFASARAAIWPQKGKEHVVDGKVQMYMHTIIRIRYQSGITTDMRVITGTGKIYEILYVKDVFGMSRVIDLWCREYD